MLANALLLLPDFLLIVCGFVVCRTTALDRSVWAPAERLVYWLLFPVLLFTSIIKSPLLVALCVPLRKLLQNPLILATVAGLVANIAGLQLGGLARAPRLATALLGIRHAVLPGVALGLGVALALPVGQALSLMVFAALPTASSCYVLAARMGGDSGYVAGLVTASTLLGMLSVPAALAVFDAVR